MVNVLSEKDRLLRRADADRKLGAAAGEHVQHACDTLYAGCMTTKSGSSICAEKQRYKLERYRLFLTVHPTTLSTAMRAQHR